MPYEICRELIEVLQGLDQAELLGDLTNRSTLITLLRAVAPVAAAHGLIDGLDVDELASAADRWTAGDDEASLIETYDNWHKLVGALDYEIAWCLSGAIDLLAHARGLDAGGRASLQQAAAVVRVRYGGPTVESCSVIRAGLARRRTLELLNEYLGRDIDDVWQAIATFREWLATYASLSEDEMLVLGIRTDE